MLQISLLEFPSVNCQLCVVAARHLGVIRYQFPDDENNSKKWMLLSSGDYHWMFPLSATPTTHYNLHPLLFEFKILVAKQHPINIILEEYVLNKLQR